MSSISQLNQQTIISGHSHVVVKKTCCQRLLACIRRCFSRICCCFRSCRREFTPEQQQRLQIHHAKRKQADLASRAEKIALQRKNSLNSSIIKLPLSKTEEQVNLEPILDQSLQNIQDPARRALRSLIGQITKIILKILFKHHIGEYINNVQEGEKDEPIEKERSHFPELMSIASTILEFLANVLGDRKIDVKLDDYNVQAFRQVLRNLLEWWLTGQDLQEVCNRVVSKMKEVAPSESAVNNYLKPIRNWFAEFSKKGKLPEGIPFDKVIRGKKTEAVRKELISQLLAEKLKGAEVKDILNKNANKVSEFLADRISDLFENASYTELIDSVVKLLNTHLSTFTQIAQNSEELIEQIKSGTVTPLMEAQAEVQEIRKDLQEGRRRIIQNDFIDQQICHPAVKGNKEELTKMYRALTETILTLLLTPKAKERDVPNSLQDSLVLLVEQLELPPIVKNVIKDINKKIPVLLPLLKGAVKDQLIASIATQLQNKIEEFVTRAQLDELASKALPVIQDLLLESYAQQVLHKQLNDFAPLLFNLMSEDKKIRRDASKNIHTQLYQRVSDRQTKFSMKEVGITEEVFKKIIRPLIKDLKKYLHSEKKHYQNKEDVKTSLKQYFKAPQAEIQSATLQVCYGQLISNLVDLSGLQGIPKSLIKKEYVLKRIGREILSLMQPYRESHQQVVVLASESIQKIYGQEDLWQKILIGPQEPQISPEEARQACQTKIRDLAKLIFDLLKLMGETSMVLRGAVSLYLKSDETELNKMITSVYENLVGDPLITLSLIFQVKDKALLTLTEAAEKLATKNQEEAA